MRILVTGALGFIGSHLVDRLVTLGHEVIGLDGLKMGSDVANANTKAHYELVDLVEKESVLSTLQKYKFDEIYHLAAESHVDRAIANAQPFIDSNITGTFNLYEAIKKCQSQAKVLLFSTDEVMGELEEGSFKEGDATPAKNLYSMTKLAQEGIARSFFYSDKIQTVISRCSNIYGPRQQEKLLPTIIKSIQTGKSIPVYGDGKQVREWTYVGDAADGAIFVMRNGVPNDIYHLGSGIEKHNIDVVKFVLKEMNAPESLIQHVADRKGHDKRYSLCIDKVTQMGWKAKVGFEAGVQRTIYWYKDHPNV